MSSASDWRSRPASLRPLRIAGVAEQLGCSERTVRRLLERGCLAGAFKVGADWRVPLETIAGYMTAHGAEPTCSACVARLTRPHLRAVRTGTRGRP